MRGRIQKCGKREKKQIMTKYMKKLYLFALSALLLTACSSEEPTFKGGKEETPSTEVYAMGQFLKGTNANSPLIWEDDIASAPLQSVNMVKAYFFIRIDGRIPLPNGMEPYNPIDYWPFDPTASKDNGSVFAEANAGTINKDYPYWKFVSNDTNTKEYLYDTTGEAVQSVLGNVPSFESMMSVNKKDVEKANSIDASKYKIIWYVAKYTYGRWHVDGVLTFNETEDIKDIPGIKEEDNLDNSADEEKPVLGQGNIEVDIHQQEHKDWQEIKTSVHVRDLVKSIKIEFPIGSQYIAESEGFAVRTYDLVLGQRVYINGTEYVLDSTNPVKLSIEHQADKTVFIIECRDQAYLNALRREYGDGATIEIHTFTNNQVITDREVWDRLKQATVKTNPATYEHLIYKGATSALFND